MATITVKRPNRSINGFRNYKIFIDRQLLGTIANNETKVFDIQGSGKHQLHTIIDWCGSPQCSINITSDENKKVLVDLHEDIFKIWPYFNYTVLSIFILDFILSEILDFPYALILLSIPLILFVYLLTFARKKMYLITEISSASEEDILTAQQS